jgi:hypothetical protein
MSFQQDVNAMNISLQTLLVFPERCANFERYQEMMSKTLQAVSRFLETEVNYFRNNPVMFRQKSEELRTARHLLTKVGYADPGVPSDRLDSVFFPAEDLCKSLFKEWHVSVSFAGVLTDAESLERFASVLNLVRKHLKNVPFMFNGNITPFSNKSVELEHENWENFYHDLFNMGLYLPDPSVYKYDLKLKPNATKLTPSELLAFFLDKLNDGSLDDTKKSNLKTKDCHMNVQNAVFAKTMTTLCTEFGVMIRPEALVLKVLGFGGRVVSVINL